MVREVKRGVSRSATFRLQWGLFFLILAPAITLLAGWTKVQVDDVYIVLRTAENLASGHGFVFSPGDRFMAVTCPLWAMILAAFRVLSPSGDLVEFARLLSIGFIGSAAMLLFALLRPALGWLAVLIGPMLLFSSQMPQHVGSEVGQCALLASAILLAVRHNRDTTAAVLFAAYYLTRGEAVLFALLVLTETLMVAHDQGKFRERLAGLALPLLVFFALTAAWHIYYFNAFGALMPKSLGVKILQGQGGWQTFFSDLPNRVKDQLKHPWVLGPLAVTGLYGLARSNRMLLAWAALHVIFYSALRVPNYYWYYYPLFVVVPIAVLFGIQACLEWWSRLTKPRWRREVWLASSLGVLGLWIPWPVPTASPERFNQYYEIAAWLNNREQVNERGKAPLILADEIGIFGYYARKFRFIDPPGILVPNLTSDLLMNWRNLASLLEPKYLIFSNTRTEAFLVVDPTTGRMLRYELAKYLKGQIYETAVYELMG